MFSEEVKCKSNLLSREIISGAIQVHKILGPGLLESAYEECLCYELNQRSLKFSRQVPVALKYKGIYLDCGYRIDVLVEDLVLLEIKCVEKFHQIHFAQTITYLRLSKLWLGLLINFNVSLLKLFI